MDRPRPTELYTARSLVVYGVCLVAAVVLSMVAFAKADEPRLGLVVLSAGALLAVSALKPRDQPGGRPATVGHTQHEATSRGPEPTAPQHLASDETAAAIKARRHLPVIRRVHLTAIRLLRTWSGRAVFAAGVIWLPIAVVWLADAAEKGQLLATSLALAGFGVFMLLLCGWRREDDPMRDPRDDYPNLLYWDWRADAGLIGGASLVGAGVIGAVLTLA